MKVLVLFASPHREGHTARLTEEFLAGLEPAETARVDLYALGPAPCVACGVCGTREECVFHDLDRVHRLLTACDLLVMAAPVYNAGLPAPMKALLDRWQRYYEARFSLGKRPPLEKHRGAALLLTQGSTDPAGQRHIAAQLERAFTVMNTALAGTVCWAGTDGQDPGGEDALARARELALAIREKMC